MKYRTISVVFVLLTLVLNATPSIARKGEDAGRGWETVKAIPAGEKLNVRLKDGKKLEGSLRSATDTTLILDLASNTSDLNRDSISKVYRVVRESAGKKIGKSTAIGTGIGFGIGAGVGIAGGTYEDLETAGLVGLLGGLGAAIGAGVGALVGSVRNKERRVLIYEAK